MKGKNVGLRSEVRETCVVRMFGRESMDRRTIARLYIVCFTGRYICRRHGVLIGGNMEM